MNVVIPCERFESLIDTETRANVLVERLYHDEILSVEDILWIIGTDLAVEKAETLRATRINGGVLNESDN